MYVIKKKIVSLEDDSELDKCKGEKTTDYGPPIGPEVTLLTDVLQVLMLPECIRFFRDLHQRFLQTVDRLFVQHL